MPTNDANPFGDDSAQPTHVVIYKTTVDANGKKVELAMNIFEPKEHKSTDKTPAIAMFFGGGWVNGSPKTLFDHCAYFASRGMVAFAPEYRIRSLHETTPFESVADGKSAIRFLRVHAETLGIDPDRLVCAGSSAGGHVAACTGIIKGFDEPNEDTSISTMPNAMLLYNPVIDTSENGYGHERLGERWRVISPLHHVRGDLPPTITFHGTADLTVPYENAVDFDAMMRLAGNDSELMTCEGAGHGIIYQLLSPWASRCINRSDEFLTSLGYLKGEPTLPIE